jgi:Chemotaxis response regulator containing a CheY-like receiver domain and a methylesterase domain
MKKNILIIDDSALMRRVLSDIINLDNRFQAVDTAVNGVEGLQILQTRAKEYDAVLLDINMPRMSGIELLDKLKEHNIKIKVIIVSTIAKKEAKETIKALELGAFDFITKPDNLMDFKTNVFSNRLLECLTLATKAESKQIANPTPLRSVPVNPVTEPINKKVITKLPKNANKLVVIACSTGGPKALHSVVPYLPENLDASVLIIQHMPGGFTKSLADRLNELSKLTVKEAEDGEVIRKGTVYIAKGGCQMRLNNREDGQHYLTVTVEPARHGLLPCADITFESLEQIEIDQIVCAVLTGMGSDGTAGISKILKKQNLYVIAQNEETSIVYGMPKVVKEAGFVDEVVALNKVSEAIVKNVGVC